MAMRNNDGHRHLAAGSNCVETPKRQEVRPKLQLHGLHVMRRFVQYAGIPALITAMVIAGLVFLHFATVNTPPVDHGLGPFRSTLRGASI